MSKKKDVESLEKIDLTKFMSGFGKSNKRKKDPICKGCKYDWCGDCRAERELGQNLKGVFESFIGQLRDGFDLDYLLRDTLGSVLTDVFDEGSIRKALDGFALRFINELKMQIKLDEGD